MDTLSIRMQAQSARARELAAAGSSTAVGRARLPPRSCAVSHPPRTLLRLSQQSVVRAVAFRRVVVNVRTGACRLSRSSMATRICSITAEPRRHERRQQPHRQQAPHGRLTMNSRLAARHHTGHGGGSRFGARPVDASMKRSGRWHRRAKLRMTGVRTASRPSPTDSCTSAPRARRSIPWAYARTSAANSVLRIDDTESRALR